MSLVTAPGGTLEGGGEQCCHVGSLPQVLPSAFTQADGQFIKLGFPVSGLVRDELSALLVLVWLFV